MRGFRVLLVAVIVAIGVGVGVEAGNVVTGPKATLKTAFGTLGASPDLEAAFTVRLPNLGSAAAESGVVKFDIESADGHSPINGQTAANLDEQISVAEGDSDLADIRVDGSDHIYFRVFFGAIGNLPSVPPSAKSALGTIGNLIGGTWFSVPSSLITGLEHAGEKVPGVTVPQRGSLPPAEQRELADGVKRWEDDILNVTHFSSASSSAGTTTTASASLRDLARVSLDDLVPLVSEVSPQLGSAVAKRLGAEKGRIDKVTGSTEATVVTDGSGMMRSGRLSVWYHGQQGSIDATFDHLPIDLGPPPGARPLPPAILAPLERELRPRQLA